MKKVFKFNSGLTLLYCKNKANKSTVLNIEFGCGARCDGELAGLSHFCEHMFFTGTNKLNKQEVTKRYYDFINVNACTDTKAITFVGSIFTHKLAEYFSVVADMICNSTFKDSAIEEEKKVIIQEIVHDKDRYKRHSSNLFKYQLYGIEAYKHKVLGDEKSVNKITSKDVKKYVKKYFVKNNCTIYISTPLSFNRTKNIVKKYFEQCLPSSTMKALPYNIETFVEEEKVNLINKDVDKNYLKIAFVFNKGFENFRYKCVLSAISNIMNDFGEGIIKPLRLEKNLVYNLDVGYITFKKQSALTISTETSSENIKKCIDEIVGYINKILITGFTKEELDKKLIAENYFWQSRISNPEDDIDDLYRYVRFGRLFEDKLVHDIIQSLTLDEVNDTLKEIFKDFKIQMQVYGNATKKDIYTLKQIKNKFNKGEGNVKRKGDK